MWGNWFIITLVTHSSGVSSSEWGEQRYPPQVQASAKSDQVICIRMSRVLVYWFESHNMLGCCMYIGLWKYTWLHDENLFGSRLPFACLIACMLFFYFCDVHQFIDGSRCERKLWSIGERRIRCIVFLDWTFCADWAFLLRQWPMYCLAFGLLLFWKLCHYSSMFYLAFGIVVCLDYCMELWLYSRTA